MSKIATITLTGASGRCYAFGVYPLDHQLPPLGAVYYISRRAVMTSNNWSHISIYVGQSSDLSTCLDDHHKKYCFAQNWVNRIGLHLDNSEESRRDKEQDLIKALEPLCND